MATQASLYMLYDYGDSVAAQLKSPITQNSPLILDTQPVTK